MIKMTKEQEQELIKWVKDIIEHPENYDFDSKVAALGLMEYLLELKDKEDKKSLCKGG